jgi:hypothetical protein
MTMRARTVKTFWLATLATMALAAATLLLAACAESRQQSIDGQSHWLRMCKSSAECGDLECICGVCTDACATEKGCASVGEDAVCRNAEDLPDVTSCAGKPASVSICVAQCKHEADCDEVGAGLVCGDGLCLPAALAHPDGGKGATSVGSIQDGAVASLSPGDAGTGGGAVDASTVDSSAGDASVIDTKPGVAFSDHVPTVAGKADGLQVDCDVIAGDALPGGLESIGTFRFEGSLVAADGVVYGTRTYDDFDGRVWRFREPSGPIEVFADSLEGVRALVPIGAELFFTSHETGAIGKIALGDGAVVNLAVEHSLVNLSSIVVDGDAVYWQGDMGSLTGTASIMRSDREPGTTVVLATVPGMPTARLQVIGDMVYFSAYVMDGEALHSQMFRVPKDGSHTAQPFGLADGVSGLYSDGVELFATVGKVTDKLGNKSGMSGIARVDLQSGTLDMLYTSAQPVFRPVLFDGDDLYWGAEASNQKNAGVWRGSKDGTSEAVNIAHGWSYIGELAVSETSVYWVVGCGTTDNLVRLPK